MIGQKLGRFQRGDGTAPPFSATPRRGTKQGEPCKGDTVPTCLGGVMVGPLLPSLANSTHLQHHLMRQVHRHGDIRVPMQYQPFQGFGCNS